MLRKIEPVIDECTRSVSINAQLRSINGLITPRLQALVGRVARFTASLIWRLQEHWLIAPCARSATTGNRPPPMQQ